MFKFIGPKTKFWYLIRFWRNKREKRNQQKWSMLHLKRWTPKVKCSWSGDVIRNKFLRSNITRSWSSSEDEKLKASKAVQWNQSRLALQKTKRTKQRLIQRIWRHWTLLRWRELTKDNCTNCITTISTTLFCLCNKTRITTMPATMFLHTWNGFEIKDNNHIRQKIIGDWSKL